MSETSSIHPSELDAFIFALIDGTISEEDHASLQKIMLEDASARKRYQELLSIHSILEERSVGDRGQAPLGAPAPFLPVEKLIRRERQKLIRRSLVAAAALLMISLAVMYYTSIKHQPPMAEIAFSGLSEYQISHPNGTSDDTPSSVLVPGSSIEIRQGVFEIKTASDTVMIIQAPAFVTLMEENKMVVHRGDAWFRVGPEVKEFTVLTPQLEVVDLGTEFGVSADPTTAQEEVHVFEGKVRVTSRHKLKKSEVLVAGEARSVRITGRLHTIALKQNRFLKSLPAELPSLAWSFDGVKDGVFPANDVTIAGEFQGVVRGGKLDLGLGKKGKALSLSNGSGHIVTNWPGVDADRPRTIQCWIKCPPHRITGAIAEWGVPLISSTKWRVGLNPEAQNEGGVQGALRTEFGFGYVIGSTDLRDNQWHHIVSIYDGSGIGNPDSIQLYVDGKREVISAYRANEIDTMLNDPASEPLTIGKKFVGMIDELKIIQGVIPPEVVEQQSKAIPEPSK